MKRSICLYLILALLLTAAGSSLVPAGQDSGEEYVDFYFETLDFTTKVPADAVTEDEEYGLRIWLDTPGYVPNILIVRRDENLKNPTKYMHETVPNDFREDFGSRLVGITQFESYSIGGKDLLATEYLYKDSNGYSVNLLHAVELRDDGDVEYYTRYTSSWSEYTLEALDAAVRSYRPAQEESAGGLEAVYCEAQDFSVYIPEALSAEWLEGKGERIYLDSPGYIPHITVWRRDGNLSDPVNFVNNVYREYMEEQYGDNYKGAIFFERYQAGGKDLVGAKYYYKANGANLCLLLLIEQRPDGDVEYHTRYIEGNDGLAPEELDEVIRSYQTGRPGASLPGDNQPKAPVINGDPVVLNTSEYSDDRFHIQLPAGWKIKTTGEYSAFSFKAWDPQAPDRSIFFFMKLEPLLKSQKAKETYQKVADGSIVDELFDETMREFVRQIYEQTGGGQLYQLYADAPVMESCTLDAFLSTVHDIREYAAKYYSLGIMLDPSVLPDMNQVKVVTKKPSSLLCPASCPDNSIACISYRNDSGAACEGLVSAQPVNTLYVDFFGVDGNAYTVYLFSGVTAPEGELAAYEPALSECLGSFGFEEDYVKDAVGLSNDEKDALLAQGEQMQALHDAMAQAWDDIIRN